MSTDDHATAEAGPPARAATHARPPPGRAAGSPSAVDVRRSRLDQEPTLHILRDGRICAAWGAVRNWLDGDPAGESLVHYFGEGEARRILDVLRIGGDGLDELQPRLLDGRRLSLAAWPVPGDQGWLLSLRDVTSRGLVEGARIHRERLEALADLAGAVARELNDPMAIVQGRLELLLALSEGDDDDPTRRHLSVALDHARRISATLRNLRVIGQRREQRLERVPIRAMLQDAMALIGPRRDRVRLSIEPADLAAGGDHALYTRVFSHALRQVVEGASRGDVRCCVEREGKAVIARVHLDSVRSVASSGRSDGLDAQDLTIDHTLLHAVGASMEVARMSGAPSFEITLPLAPATRGRPRAGDEPLLVVGRETFTDTVQELLDKDGFRFDVARDMKGALQLAEPVEHRAAITEFLLPGGRSGVALGRCLVRRRPSLVGQLIVVADNRLDPLPSTLVSLARPLSRAVLLQALGRRVRHR